MQGESDSHYKRHLRPYPQRVKEIAQNEDGPGGRMGRRVGGGAAGAGEVSTAVAQCRESWPQISQPGGRVLDRTGESARGRWVKDSAKGERPGEGERDRWIEVLERRQDIDRGGIVFQELAAKNMFPSCR